MTSGGDHGGSGEEPLRAEGCLELPMTGGDHSASGGGCAASLSFHEGRLLLEDALDGACGGSGIKIHLIDGACMRDLAPLLHVFWLLHLRLLMHIGSVGARRSGGSNESVPLLDEAPDGACSGSGGLIEAACTQELAKPFRSFW